MAKHLQSTSLVQGKICRKSLYLMGKSMVSGFDFAFQSIDSIHNSGHQAFGWELLPFAAGSCSKTAQQGVLAGHGEPWNNLKEQTLEERNISFSPVICPMCFSRFQSSLHFIGLFFGDNSGFSGCLHRDKEHRRRSSSLLRALFGVATKAWAFFNRGGVWPLHKIRVITFVGPLLSFIALGF